MNAWSPEEFKELTKDYSKEEAKSWIDAANKSFDEFAKTKPVPESMKLAREAADKIIKELKANQTFNLEGVEIFSVGKWNGDAYTQKDIDAIISSFGKVGFEPPLKLGHNKEQEAEILRDGQPALGWVERLYTEGGKLLADFSHVPLKLYEAMKRKNYTNISSEIYLNFDFNGAKFSRVLRAVSLLGADIPAVGGLKGIVELYSKEGKNASSDEFKIYITKEDKSNEEAEKMEKAELEKQLAEEKKAREASEKALKEANEAKAASDKEAENAKAELAQKEADVKLKENDSIIKELKKEGKIIPAFEEEAKALLISASETKCFTYSHEGKTLELSQRETVIRFFNALGKQISFKEHGKGGGGGGGDDSYSTRKEAGEEVHKRATELMKEDSNIKTYSEATQRILNSDPDLKAAYAQAK